MALVTLSPEAQDVLTTLTAHTTAAQLLRRVQV